jgi:hypothetical protein
MEKLVMSLGPGNAALVALLEASEQEFVRQLFGVRCKYWQPRGGSLRLTPSLPSGLA